MRLTKWNFTNRVSGQFAILSVIGLVSLSTSLYAIPQFSSDNVIQLSSPISKEQQGAKYPKIRVSIAVPYNRKSLNIVLDNEDITALVKVDATGIDYQSLLPLHKGLHLIRISIDTADNITVDRQLKFETRYALYPNDVLTQREQPDVTLALDARHTFKDEFGSEQDSHYVRGFVQKTQWTNRNGSGNIVSDYWYENHAASTSLAGRKSTLAYFNFDTLNFKSFSLKTFDLKAFNLKTAQWGGISNLGFGLENFYSFRSNTSFQSLAPSSGNFHFGLHKLQLSTFKSDWPQSIAFGNAQKASYVKGLTTEYRFLDRLKLKTLYAANENDRNSSNLYSWENANEERIVGLALSAELVPGKLAFEVEYDHSKYDSNSLDTTRAIEDDAFALRLTGTTGSLNYNTAYEYLGTDYRVVGNQSLLGDRAIFTAGANIQQKAHSWYLKALSQYDNVENSASLPRLRDYQLLADYYFAGFNKFTFGMTAGSSILSSENDPIGFSPYQINTKTIGGSVNYTDTVWNVTLQMSNSSQNDRTLENNDSSINTFSFVPVYKNEQFFISPNLTFIKTDFDQTGATREQTNLALNLRGKFRKFITYEMQGTYIRQELSDDTSAFDTLNTDFKVAYELEAITKKLQNSSVGLVGRYRKNLDNTVDQITKDWVVSIVFSWGVPNY